MKLRDACLAVMIAVLVTSPTLAAPSPTIREMVKKLSTSIPAPAEWQGVWSEADSAYTCDPLTFSDFSTELDTFAPASRSCRRGPRALRSPSTARGRPTRPRST